MPYGLPCPDTAQPDAVFPLVSEADAALAGFMGAVQQQLTTFMFQAQGLINNSTYALSDWVQKQLKSVNLNLGKIWDLLQQQLTATNFVGTVQLGDAINSISQSLQTSTDEVINGPAIPSPLGPAVPAFALPSQGMPQPTVGPIAMPGAPPTYPGQSPQPTCAPPPRLTIMLDGTPTTVTPICYPVTLPDTVMIGGVEYDPHFTVFYTGKSLGVSADGTPTLPISYDIQRDGSIVVNVGPLSVQMRLPASQPGQPDFACDQTTG